MALFSRMLFRSNEEVLFSRWIDHTEREDNRLFWQLNGLVWGVVSLSGFILMSRFMDVRTAAFFALTRMVSGFAITTGLREVYRRLPWRRMRLIVLAAGVILLSVGLSMMEDFVTQRILYQLVTGESPDGLSPALTATGMVIRVGSYAGWSLFYFGLNLWRDGMIAKLRLARSEAAARTAELRELQAQVQPHFLFNALNSIIAERHNPTIVEQLGQSLADYLRYSLRNQQGFAPLGDELDQMERHLRVEQVRFGEHFSFAITADDAVRMRPAPPALLQPLVENACKYGRRSSPRLLRVGIAARLENGFVRITVANSGRWHEGGGVPSTGTGLVNLQRRLELLSQGRARLERRTEHDEVAMTVWWPSDAPVSMPGGGRR